MEVAELFNHLESNQPQVVEEIKKTFHENFNATKESWLVAGLFDYYVNTSSVRSVEIMVGVREPHDKHLFDKILEALKGSSKLQAVTLLGHVVRRQPTWLYKVTHHPLMKELIKLLKAETEILPLMSALLVLIVLLPMLPALMGPFLPDIFEVFSRLAAWKCTNPNKVPEEHLLHLQVALYALFQRLYGMYPCNFLSFLRLEYSRHENLGTFSHTIKPMLDTVKMHPLLVTHSKEGEITAARWKKMEHHDVILECAKFALDTTERMSCTSIRPRAIEYPGSNSLEASYQNHQASLAITGANETPVDELWSPSVHCGFITPPPQETAATPIPHTPNSSSYIVSTLLPHQEGTSPPEAAIEATPETTPIKDVRNVGARAPINSNVVRALNSFGNAKWPVTSNSSTPSQSQPSSPMKKEAPPFHFPSENTTPNSAFEQPRRDSLFQVDPRRDLFLAQKVQKVLQDRNQMTLDSPPIDKLTMNLRPKSSGIPPTSPLRVIGPYVPNSPIPMDTTAPVPGGKVSRPTPEKNGFRFDVPHDSTREDQEVDDIVCRAEQLRTVSGSSIRQCDSVLQDIHAPHVDDYEECQQDSGSPCTSGGLHMANSRSMLDFARRVAMKHRQRFYSQCIPEPSSSDVSFSTGSSPGDEAAFLQQFSVRRTNSCPEMKKIPSLPGAEMAKVKTLHEKEELEIDLTNNEIVTNGRDVSLVGVKETSRHVISTSTQTLDHWAPLPYEHLFLEILPHVEYNGEMRSFTAPSPAPVNHQSESPFPRFSPYAMLDKYIDTVAQAPQPKDEVKKSKSSNTELEMRILKEQLFLLNIQLQFERHRREVHAERNRRLLGKSRSTRAMEEHNSALREQLSLLQADIEQLHVEHEKKRKESKGKEQQYQETINYWQRQCNTVQKEVKELKIGQQILQQECKHAREKTATVVKECQEVEKKLFDVVNDMQHAVAQANVGAQLHHDIAQLQREMLLMGELQQRYREQAARRALMRHHSGDEVVLVRDTSKAEIMALHEMLDTRNSMLEAVKARVTELETAVTRRDMIVGEQKRSIKQVKEEYRAQLEAVESKCETQRAINQRMEEHIVYLTNQLEESERGRVRSPDSSIHEVSVSVSSAGSAVGRLLGGSPPAAETFRLADALVGENIGMKNLQLIVEQNEQVLRTQKSCDQPNNAQHVLESSSSTLGEG